MNAAFKLRIFKRIFKQAVIDLHHDIAIHLDKPAIAVIGKTRIIGAAGKAFDRDVIQPKIENRVHHARHRGTRTRPNRNKKRVNRIGKTGASFAFDFRNGITHLLI